MADLPDCKNLKALVVDDHLVIRRLIEQYLRNIGFENIDVVATGQEASDKLSANGYDIVFLDWNMPGKSGYAVLQECRQEDRFDNVAFVMVTAESHERYVIEALKAGANSYITKPFSQKSFDEKVRKVLTWLHARATAAKVG